MNFLLLLFNLWSEMELNHQHEALQTYVLPTELSDLVDIYFQAGIGATTCRKVGPYFPTSPLGRLRCTNITGVGFAPTTFGL